MRAAILCLLLSAVAISADLESDIDDIASHLPIEQLVQLGQKYVATRPDVREGLVYLQTLNMEELLHDFFKIKEVHDIVEYFKSRGIDAERLQLHVLNMALEFYRQILKQQSPGQIRSAVPATSGDILMDMIQVVRSSDIRRVIAQKIEESPEFANFVNALRDPEYKRLIYRFANSKTFTGERDSSDPQVRGFFSKVWKKIKDIGFGVGVSIPIGK